MAERSVVVRLKAEIADFKRQMDAARRSVSDVGDETGKQSQKATTALGRLVQSADKNRESWDRIGTTLIGFGVATVGALGLATKAAIDWESAFAGVRKTVDGSDAEIAALEGELRQLARTLPASHQQIAAVAEAAGQLGVAREDITAFTRTMIDLGETTNLTADEAAMSLAQFMNVMSTAGDDVDNLGAALVELGNNGASTERDILMMGQRIAGAGRQIGLTEGEVLGFASALASVGIEAEAGGSAISRVMIETRTAVDEGGAALETFARVSGMSAQQFATAFRDDAGGAVISFIQGLGRMEEQGQSTTPVLEELGFTDLRVADALRRAAADSDGFTEALRTGNAAFEANTALATEAAKRYETTAAQLQITKNNVTDAAIGFGEVLLPAVKGASEAVRDLSEWLGGLDDGQKNAIVSAAGLAGGAALVGGAFLLTFPRIIDTVNAFRDLRDISPKAADGLGKVGKAAGIAAAALAGANVAFNLLEGSGNAAVQSTSEATEALAKAGLTAEQVDAQIRSLKEANNDAGFDTLQEGLESLADPSLYNRLQDLTREVFSLGSAEGRTAREDLVKQLEATGQALATIAESGNAELAAEQFTVYEAAAKAAGMSTEELLDLMPAYRDALADAEAQQQLTAGGADQLTFGLGGVVQTTQDAESAVDAFRQSLDRLLGDTFSVEEATDQFEQALIDLAEAAKANGAEIDGNSQAAIRNREQMRATVNDAAGLIAAYAQTGRTTSEVAAFTDQLKARLYDQARQAGFSEDAASRYASALDQIPGVYEATVKANTSQAVAALDEVLSRVTRLDGRQAVVTVTTRNVQTGRQSVQTTRMEADGDLLLNRGGSLVAAFADGGHYGLPPIGAQQPQISPNRGPMGIMWAETGAGPWEAFISGHPAKRGRSIDIWERTGDMLGLRFQRFDSGGFFGGAGGPVTAQVGPVTARLSTTDIWEFAHAVSRVTVSLNGRAVSQELGGEMRRAGVR